MRVCAAVRKTSKSTRSARSMLPLIERNLLPVTITPFRYWPVPNGLITIWLVQGATSPLRKILSLTVSPAKDIPEVKSGVASCSLVHSTWQLSM